MHSFIPVLDHATESVECLGDLRELDEGARLAVRTSGLAHGFELFGE